MPMQPRPCADTTRPWLPSRRCSTARTLPARTTAPSGATATICHVATMRRYPPCVERAGRPTLRTLHEVVALPRRGTVVAELERALAAAARVHLLRTDLAPVPVRTTAATTEAGAY